MSLYLACNAADVFASVAPSSFDLMIDSEEPCHPSRLITEIAYRGTSDPLVSYDGGASTPPNNSSITVHFLGAVGTFQTFCSVRRVHRHADRCRAEEPSDALRSPTRSVARRVRTAPPVVHRIVTTLAHRRISPHRPYWS
jgi:poly(3-hydroxybutyrate) depolymerase